MCFNEKNTFSLRFKTKKINTKSNYYIAFKIHDPMRSSTLLTTTILQLLFVFQTLSDRVSQVALFETNQI